MTEPQTETIHHDLNDTEWALLNAELDRANTILARAKQLEGQAKALLPAAYRTILGVYGVELAGTQVEVDPDERVLTAVVVVPQSMHDPQPEPNLDLLEHDAIDTEEDAEALVQDTAPQNAAPTEEQCST